MTCSKLEDVSQVYHPVYSANDVTLLKIPCEEVRCLKDSLLRRRAGIKRPHLVFADPPYNLGVDYGKGKVADMVADEDFSQVLWEWISAAVIFLKPNGVLAWMISEQYADVVSYVLERTTTMEKVQHIIWHETFHTYHERTFPTAHRHIFIYHKKAAGELMTWNPDAIRVPSARQLKYKDKRANARGRVPGSVWTISRTCGTFKARVNWHPTQLPVALLERLVLAFSNTGDTIADMFCGSGTMGLAALPHGRRFVGFEINDDYLRECALMFYRFYHTKEV